MGSPLSMSWRALPAECMTTGHEIVSSATLWVNVCVSGSLSGSPIPFPIAFRKQFFPWCYMILKDSGLTFSHKYRPVLICKARLNPATWLGNSQDAIWLRKQIPFLALLPCGPVRGATPLWIHIFRNRSRYHASLTLIHLKSQSTKS